MRSTRLSLNLHKYELIVKLHPPKVTKHSSNLVKNSWLQCIACEKVFLTPANVVSHWHSSKHQKRATLGKDFFCTECSVFFLDIAALESHWNQQHNSTLTAIKLDRFYCEYCNLALQAESDIEFHFQTKEHQAKQEKHDKKKLQKQLLSHITNFELDEVVSLITNFKQKYPSTSQTEKNKPHLNLEDS
jgi:hypothetical protein